MSNFQYTIVFKNHSKQQGNACIFQTDPNQADSTSLVWLSRYVFPTTTVNFQWTTQYGMAWAETGELHPGIVVTASQYWNTNLETNNQINLNYQHNAFTFQDPRPAPQTGSLVIQSLANVPPNRASVGIGMAGSPFMMVQAQPNITAVFTPKTEYWIVFGTYTQGEVVGIETFNQAVQIQFPVNTYSMTAILNPDMTWTVEPTTSANARLVEAKASDPQARFGEV